MYTEYETVQRCLLVIEKKLDWGDAGKWHNDMYSELSERIQKETNVLLSPTTLKRVWGKVQYHSAPSITTLNTLSRFAGYRNWREFKTQTATNGDNSVKHTVRSNLGIIMLAASVMTVVFISLYSLKGSDKNTETVDLDKITFGSRPLSEGLPNSVVFEVGLDDIDADSVHIQQYWDPTKTIALKKGQRQATGQYYFPGYFRAKLIADGDVLKEHDLFITSGGWLGTINYEPVPKYIMGLHLGNGPMSLPPAVLKEIESSEKPLSSTFHWVGATDQQVSGDNFVLSAGIHIPRFEKWAVCRKAAIYILGTKGAMIIPFALTGCVSEIGLMLNDFYLSGKENDLSALGIDLSAARNIQIENTNRQVSIRVDNKEVISESYTRTMGNLVGIRLQFLGAGEVAYCRISDPDQSYFLVDDGFPQ